MCLYNRAIFPVPTQIPHTSRKYATQMQMHKTLTTLAIAYSSDPLQHFTKVERSQTQVHSAKTHHLALLSASTRPLQTPRSPTLIIVSQVPPSPLSIAWLVLCVFSSLRINLNTLPPGAWIANFAGFLVANAFVALGLEPEAEELVIDIADVGRMKGIGEVPPGLGDVDESEDGCWRMAKTKVLFRARRWH
jgi:hypothetical protein